MASPDTISPEERVFTFKQKSDESIKEAWSRIHKAYNETEPRMTLGLLLSSFYFGLTLRYRYALDTLVGGDFLQCDGDQAFNAIKKLMVTYPSDFDSALGSIYARLNTLETSTYRLNECYCQLREKFDHTSTNSEPSIYLPT